MINRRTFAVVKREAKEQVMSKSFVVATITLPILMFLVFMFMGTVGSVKNDDATHITVVANLDEIRLPLKELLDEYNFVQSGQYTIDYRQLDPTEFAAFLDAERTQLLDDNNRGIFLIPDMARYDKKIQFYSSNPKNADARAKISNAVDAVLNRNYFEERGINPAELDFIQKETDVEGIKVSKTGVAEETYGNLIIAIVFTCLLMMSLVFTTTPLPAAVVGEKSNRIAEVLISSLSPQELFAGKLIARALTSVLQMAIWVAFFWALIWITTDVVPIPESFQMTLSAPVFAYFVVNHLLGIMIFITLFAGLASVYDNLHDANAVIVPCVMLIILPFYAAFTLLSNPANTIAATLSLSPFTSLYVMPARIALIDVPPMEILTALAVNVGVLVVLLIAMGKIYKIGIMTTGRKPTLKEVFGWLRTD